MNTGASLRSSNVIFLSNNGSQIVTLYPEIIVSVSDSINVDGHTLSSYAVKMSNPSEWGSALEIAAAAEMLSVGTYIYELRRGREIQS